MIVDAESLRPRERHRAAARGRRGERAGQARAHGVRARDRHGARSPTPPRPAPSCAACAARCARRAAARGLAIGSAGTHPFALWEDQRIVARPRYRDLISDLRWVARQELIFGMHVHVGIDDPDKAIHVANGMRVHLAGPAGAERQLAVLAGRRDRPAVGPHADLPRVPAGRRPARLPRLGGLRAADRVHGRLGRHGGLHVPLVRRPAPSEARHGRDAGLRQPDARGAHARPRRADPGDGPGAGRAPRRRPEPVGLPVADARREQVARRPPRARRRARRPAHRRARRRPARWPAGWWTACAGTPRIWARPAELEGIEDLLSRGNGASRQVVVYEANHDLREVMAEIVAATVAVGSARTGARPLRPIIGVHGPSARPVRRVQEVRGGGQPVHHRVPVLRHPAAQAGAEDRARRHGVRAGARAQAAPAAAATPARGSAACAPARSPASAASAWPVRGPRSCWRRSRSSAALRSRSSTVSTSAVVGPVDGEWWRLAVSPFVYGDVWYQLAAVAGDRRLRLAAGAPPRPAGRPRSCSRWAARAAPRWRVGGRSSPLALGGNGAALALLCAWAVPDVIRRAPRARTTRATCWAPP